MGFTITLFCIALVVQGLNFVHLLKQDDIDKDDYYYFD